MSSPVTLKKQAPVNKTDAATRNEVMKRVRAGISNVQIGKALGIGESTVRRIRTAEAEEPSEPRPILYLDKKIGGFNWRDSIPVIKGMQKLRGDSSWSQATADIRVGDGVNPVTVMQLSDTHIGAFGTNYDLFVELTDLIINTPNLFFVLNGDEVEWAVKLRGVAEVCAQVLDPSMQIEFVESWLEEVVHKLLWATWSNHSTMRSEQAIGACPIKNILAKKAPYFSGIGHPTLLVGDQSYKIAVSHKFSGVTAMDVTAGCKKYLRLEAPDREIAIQGDAHRAGVSVYNEGGQRRIALCSGTLNVRSGFAQRHCSLITSTAFPVITFFPDTHLAVPFMTIAEQMACTGQEYTGTISTY
jgi:hypothetical protein